MSAEPESMDTVIQYQRRDNLVRLTIQRTTNHELREVMVGLWARLSDADRADHIRELTSYQEDEDSWLSPVASVIAQPEAHDGFVDVSRAKRFEHGELP